LSDANIFLIISDFTLNIMYVYACVP